ncbi:hypothetical protein [Sphaerotilus mobilis]|uniref:Uncharacterized protein n=1 Tax=Sphaerotilus mobilis TaxID=47994 RepID=A0A4V2EWM9_9BURK|nr:hypothetical protein [Sphaerotilus mobilis]RZS56550.1 hypothetical protein EV685_1099 [Sphaerotilus mobilis]
MALINDPTPARLSESDKLGIAAHLHVAMRRKIGRVTDVEWLVRDATYAREVIRIALAERDHPELQGWALKLQAALFPPTSTQTQTQTQTPTRTAQAANSGPMPLDANAGADAPLRPAQGLLGRYVGGLR